MYYMDTLKHRVDILDPKEETIDIEDIANALSHVCRFGGHCKEFYSVAQHSCAVADRLTDPKLKLAGLLHDASEAYLGDIIQPLKYTHIMDEYRIYELRMEQVIINKFKLPVSFQHPAIKEADLNTLVDEAYILFKNTPDWVPIYAAKRTYQYSSPDYKIRDIWSPELAYNQFMERVKKYSCI